MAVEQLEWVFDSLVEFLRGPIWNIPVLTFIEQKSVVFEPGAENAEELKKIHEDYKNLVDFMLGSYMEDLRITPEEFERSCSVASKTALNQFHQSLFQQVWAADDFEIFKRMMTQKNLELQLQALEFLTQKRGSVPNCMEQNNHLREDVVIEEIIKKAIEDVAIEPQKSELNQVAPDNAILQEQMKLEAEKEFLEKAIKQSVVKDKEQEETLKTKPKETNGVDQVPSVENEPESNGLVKVEEQSTPAAPQSTPVQEKDIKSQITKEKEINLHCELPKLELLGNEAATESTEVALKTLPPLKISDERPWSEGDSTVYVQAQVEVTPIELEKRQSYLRQQRDRILAMKKQERARRLSNTEEVIAQSRPKSARAARQVLREESTEVDPQTLAFRKSLAAKLRSEVVDKVD